MSDSDDNIYSMDPYKQIYRLLNCEFYKIEVEKFPEVIM